MADYAIPKAGVAYIFYTGLVSQADTKLLKSAPTLAAGDFKISIDGGAFANLATLPTNTPSGTSVKISLSAGEMTGDNILVACIDAAGAEWCDQIISIQTSPVGLNNLATPTNITAGTITTVTTLTGHTPQTGDSFARIGVAGAGLTNIDLPNQTFDLIGNITGNLSGSIGSVATGGITTASFFAGATLPRVTLVDTTTTNTDMRGTDSAALAATALSTTQWTNALATNLGTTNTTVAAIGATGTGLSVIPWNAAWDAEVQSEVQDAITASALATAANLLIVSDGVGYLTAALLGTISDAGTAGETYVVTFGGATYTLDYTGLDATGNRTGVTRTKT